ncbi:MAG TPA: invasin domain 3-containing protein [Vicinamibacterales bacterium]|nr:invasin domain 3-containing protein [Vicinamibacterales bacterium]
MQIRTAGILRAGAALLIAGSVAACTESQEPPSLTGPSGLSQTLTLSASPDRIAHNGSAQSVVTLTMHDGAGQPLSGQRVSLGTSSGTLSHADVVTGTDGRAAFIVTAPALSVPAEDISVFATPFGTDAGAALTRVLRIAFTGPSNTTAPQPEFVFSPETPVAGVSTAFDASATTDEGVQCVTCTFTWTFPTETASGMGANYTLPTGQFPQGGTFVVTLTVRDSTGSESTLRRAVTWDPPAPEEE